MRVLLVGASGFLGRFVEKELLHRGHSVVPVDVSAPRHESAVPADRWIVGDIRTLDWKKVGASTDAVICTAASLALGRSRADWGKAVTVNVLGLQRLLEWALHSDVGSFVFTSSAGMYIRNQSGEPISEQAPVNPPAAYWTTKLLMEQLVFSDDMPARLTPWALRLSSPYGPGQRPGSVLPRFIQAASRGQPLTIFDGGSRSQDFIWVEDAAAAHVRCIEATGPSCPGPINLGSGEETSMLALARTVSDVFSGSKASIVDVLTPNPDRTRMNLDITRARDLLELEPRSLRVGLESLRGLL